MTPSKPKAEANVDRPWRIEMIAPALDAGGMEVVILDLAQGLAESGHQVGVTCLVDEGTLAPLFREAGVEVTLVPTPGVRTIALPRSLRDWLRGRSPDIVHTHSGGWHKGARGARLAGVPAVVHTVHGLVPDKEPWFGTALRRMASSWTDQVAVVSSPLATFLTETCGLPQSRVAYVPNGIDTNRFRPGASDVPENWPIDDGEGPIIGTVARLAPEKNQRLLIEAFSRVAAEFPRAQLVLVGEGPERPILEQKARSLGVSERVHLPGFISETQRVYPRLDLFVLPSDFEGTSISLLEAMASGCCVVATEVGGNPDVLAGGDLGLLVPPRDPEQLAARMRQALGCADLRIELGRLARRQVEEHHSRRSMVSAYEALYELALTKKARRIR